MGTDYRLVNDAAYLDLQGMGLMVYMKVPLEDPLCERDVRALGDVSKQPWKGLLHFVRDHGEATIVSEHDEEGIYDAPGRQAFSLFARTGHWKKKGYGPLEEG